MPPSLPGLVPEVHPCSRRMRLTTVLDLRTRASAKGQSTRLPADSRRGPSRARQPTARRTGASRRRAGHRRRRLATFRSGPSAKSPLAGSWDCRESRSSGHAARVRRAAACPVATPAAAGPSPRWRGQVLRKERNRAQRADCCPLGERVAVAELRVGARQERHALLRRQRDVPILQEAGQRSVSPPRVARPRRHARRGGRRVAGGPPRQRGRGAPQGAPPAHSLRRTRGVRQSRRGIRK